MMPTEAQIAANRENAKKSTGPRTATGKTASAANSTKFGLYSESNCVHPHQNEEFDALRDALVSQLRPSGPLEEMLAADIIRAAWRVRRCADAEEALAEANQAREIKDAQSQRREPDHPEDTLIYHATCATQQSIDRARAQALSIRRRALLDLEKLQNERFLRDQLSSAGLLDQAAELAQYGLASVKHVAAVFRKLKTQGGEFLPPQNEPNPAALRAAVTADQTPRNALCPCNSGLKFKRCCGEDAPPVLGPQPLPEAA